MSTPVIIGILIILLVVGVPILQALFRVFQRLRSLRIDGVALLADAAAVPPPAGFALQLREAITSEDLAFEAEDPESRIRDLDDAGRVVGFHAQFRDPRSWGEFADFALGATLHRRRPLRRIEVELTRYGDEGQARAALDDEPSGRDDDDVRVVDAGEVEGFRLREWTRSAGGEVIQRMVEYRASRGNVLIEVSADAEPADAAPTDAARDLADAVRRRIPEEAG